jgi:transglutaminase-like putative cysteine protease
MTRFLLVVWLLSGSSALAQHSPLWEKMKAVYPENQGVYLERNKVITLRVQNDSLHVSGDMKESILYLKDPASASEWRIYGSYFIDVQNLTAQSLVWQKNRYKELEIKNIPKKREDDNSVFYDDSYFYQLLIPNALAENQARWNYREEYRDARFLGSFSFGAHWPQIIGSFTIKAIQGIEITWKVLNDPDNNIQFKTYDKGGYTYYEWSVQNSKTFTLEDHAPKPIYYLPLVTYSVKSYPSRKGAQRVLNNLDDLYAWYVTHLRKQNETPSHELDSIVKSLVRPGDDEMTIVRKVFYWVQDNVRYIAFEDGMRGLVPHNPSFVCNQRYGDCKDMASLVVGMLKVAGIKAYHTWIGTRDLPYRYTEWPTPGVDNHMIATYIDKHKNYYFLDATGNYTSVDFPSSMTQGKEGLIALDDTHYEIREVPVIPHGSNLQTDSVELKIDGRALTGKGTAHFTGYPKIDLSYSVDKAREDAIKENVKAEVSKGNNKFVLTDFSVQHLHDKELPLAIHYRFSIGDYVQSLNQEIYVNLNLEKRYYNRTITATRKVPYENDFMREFRDTYTLIIPEGYEISYVPADAAYAGKNLGFNFSYERTGNTLILHRTLYTNFLLLQASEFADWNEGIRLLSQAYKETVLLKKITP